MGHLRHIGAESRLHALRCKHTLAHAALQALRPGAVKLGLHKGEAYFARQDVQELHTRERWEREGRQVSVCYGCTGCSPHAMLTAFKVFCCLPRA